MNVAFEQKLIYKMTSLSYSSENVFKIRTKCDRKCSALVKLRSEDPCVASVKLFNPADERLPSNSCVFRIQS